MVKAIDWKAEEAKAARMTTQELLYAKSDAYHTARIWAGVDPADDPDGNYGFYMDQVSVYARALAKLRKE